MDGKDSADADGKASCDAECSICLQSFVQPVELPCKHVFCYLCVKGIRTLRNKNCPLCRQVIPRSYMYRPQLLHSQTSTDSYQWFYKGQNGWWQYDDRTGSEIETAYQNDEQQCEILIAGSLYIIDFQLNMQIKKYNPVCRRNIKRDLVTICKKGIAGIYQSCSSTANNSEPSCSRSELCNTAPQNRTCNKVFVIVPEAGEPEIVIHNKTSLPPNNSSHSNASSACGQTIQPTMMQTITRVNTGVQTSPDTKELAESSNNNFKEVTLQEKKVASTSVPNSNTVGVCTRSETEVLSERFNCRASCSNANNVISSEKRTTEDCDELSSSYSKRKKTNLKFSKSTSGKKENICTNFSIIAASKLSEMSYVQRLYAEKIINDTLFEGQMGKLSASSHLVL